MFPLKHKEPIFSMRLIVATKELNTTEQPHPIQDFMSGHDESGNPPPRIPLGLNLEQACELGRGNAIHQLHENYQTLLNEVAQTSTSLWEVLTHLRHYLRGGGRRNHGSQRGDSTSTYSSSSQEDE